MIFRSKTSLGDVTVDAVLRVKHGVELELSTSPLEDGAEITDHARVLPQGMEMVGIITPTEQTLLGQLTSLGEDAERDVQGWMALKAMITARRRIEVVTRYQTYFVLPITLLADEDAGFGMALQFTMRFVEIEQGSVSSLDQIALDQRDSIGGKVGTDNLGRKQLGPAEPVPAAKAKAKPRIKNAFNVTGAS